METISYALSNGLRVVLRSQRGAPVVSMSVHVGVGSADEGPGEEGLAHVHEHMLFKGTATRGVGEIARLIEASGGSVNAYTSFEETVYYATLSSRFWHQGLDILSDAVRRPAFDPDELARELDVILEELSRGEDDPGHQTVEALFGLAYQEHPYGRPVIGTRASIQAFTREDVLAFFQRWYVASNMTLVIVGDFTLEDAKQTVARFFEDMPTVPVPTRQVPRAPTQTRTRTKLCQGPSTEVHLALSFPIPAMCHEDAPALDLLRIMLSYGEASLLTQRLDRELAWVNGINAGAYMPRQPGLFFVVASYVPGPEHPGPEALTREILQLLTQATAQLDDEGLGRARSLLESSKIYGQQTIQGQARTLGFYATCPKGLSYEDEYYQELASLTPADLRRTLRRLLEPHKLSAVIYASPEVAQAHPDLEASLAQAAHEGLTHQDLLPGPYTAKLERDAHGIARLKIEGGPTLVLQEDRSLALVSLRTAFLGGLRYETSRTAGMHNLLATLWARSTATMDTATLCQETENLGCFLDAFAGRNTLGAQVDVLSKNLAQGLSLFGDVLLQPAFDAEEMAREKRLLLEDYQAQRDNPGRVAARLIAQSVYGQHPYGLPSGGTPTSLQHLTRESVMDYYAQIIHPEGMVLSVVGDFQAEEMAHALTDKLLARPWRSEDAPTFAAPSLTLDPLPGARHFAVSLPKQQAHVALVFRGLEITDPAGLALEALMAVLSGQGGRLFLELRDRQSLAYSVYAYSASGLEPGHVCFYIATSPDKVETAVRGLLEQVQRLRAEPITPEELDRAKVYLLGHHDIGLQRFGARAITMALDELYGMGYNKLRYYADKIQSLQASDIQALCLRLLDPASAQLITVMPEDQPLPTLTSYGFPAPEILGVDEIFPV